MPAQSLLQRVTRLASDANDSAVDIVARWDSIADTVGADAAAALGPIPSPTLDDIPLEMAVQYAARDADATLRLYPILSAKIDEMGLRQALELDEAVVPMVSRMQANGMLVDRSHIAVLNEVFTDTLADIEFRAHTLAGHPFLLTSGDQVAVVLYDELGLGGRRRTKSGKRLSTDEKALESLAGRHPIIALLQEHREVSKLKTSYTDVLPTLLSPDGRIRMELGLTTVPSGRLNCWGGVNLLAIPVRTALGREIRRAFVAPPGYVLGSLDLNQIELRWLAILSGDERMLDAFATGKDLHALTAAQMYHVPFSAVTFEQRQRGKTVNFAIANQISALGLYDQFMLSGVTDVDAVGCQHTLDTWYSYYAAVQPWYESVYAEGKRHGYIRDSVSGRILYTPGLRSPLDKVRMDAERVATNWKIQTAAQATMKYGMVRLWEWLTAFDFGEGKWPIEAILQVHDEWIFEAETDMADDGLGKLLCELLVSGVKAPIPITAGHHYGTNWATLK